MFVSGSTSSIGPLCLVASGKNGQVSLAPCFDAIASGDGKDVFTMSDSGTLSSMTRSDSCLVLAGGDAIGGGNIELSSCKVGLQADDGRASFQMSEAGQIRFARMGNYCLSAMG